MNEPNFQDLVKNKNSNVTGTVIAKYPEEISTIGKSPRNLLDIRLETSGDRGVWYGSPAELWEVVKSNNSINT